MIHLFHGENIVVSRKEMQLLKEKNRQKELVLLDGKKMSITEFIQATESTSLFGSQRLVIVENAFSRRFNAKSKELPSFLLQVKRIPPETEVLFWEEKELGKTVLSGLPRSTDIALFKPDRYVFTFTEAIKPKNTAQLLVLFDKACQKDAVEMVFAMLVRQFHYLIMIKDLGDRIAELSPWQAKKFATQAQYFSYPQLVALYEHLLEIDVKIKTGQTPFTLA